MKLLVVILAVVGLSYAAPSKRDLASDLQQIAALIPIDEIREIARRYNADDPEFQQVVAYLKGGEWAELVDAVGENESWQRFKLYLLANDVDIDAILAAIREIIDSARVIPQTKGQRSLRSFVDEVRALIDLDEILLTVNRLLITSENFQEFFVILSGDESRTFVEDVRAIPEVQRIAEKLRNFGINVDAALEFVYGILGWE